MISRSAVWRFSPSAAASVSYAAVYPLVMGLRIFAPQLLVLMLFVFFPSISLWLPSLMH